MERHLKEAAEVFNKVENSLVIQELWTAYQKKFSYAFDLGGCCDSCGATAVRIPEVMKRKPNCVKTLSWSRI